MYALHTDTRTRDTQVLCISLRSDRLPSPLVITTRSDRLASRVHRLRVLSSMQRLKLVLINFRSIKAITGWDFENQGGRTIFQTSISECGSTGR
jgi:hypothetical protein